MEKTIIPKACDLYRQNYLEGQTETPIRRSSNNIDKYSSCTYNTDISYTQRHKLRTAYSTNDCRGK